MKIQTMKLLVAFTFGLALGKLVDIAAGETDSPWPWILGAAILVSYFARIWLESHDDRY